jgi:PAS domain S-box-containing protein
MTPSGNSRRTGLDRRSFEAIAETIPHIVWLADASGSTDYFNWMGTDYTGFPRQANYGWQWLDLVHVDDMARAQLGWEHAAASATPFELSYRIRKRDGTFRWHAFRALPMRGPNNEILRWIGTADDLDDLTQVVDDATRIDRQIVELRNMLSAAQPVASERFGFVEPRLRIARVNDELASAPNEPASLYEPTGIGANGNDAIDLLAPREVAVARLVASGYTNEEIANLLALSLRTIEASRARLRRVLGVRTRAELVRFAHRTSLRDGAQDLDRGLDEL